MKRGAVATFGAALTAAFASAWLPGTSGAYDVVAVEGAGSVSGAVRFESDRPEPSFVRVDKDVESCGVRHQIEEFVVDPESGGLRNVVAVLDGIDAGKGFPEGTEIQLDQVGCRYEPHVQIAFLPGATDGNGDVSLVILNSDDVFHNVHAYEGAEGETTVFNTPSIPEEAITEAIDGTGLYQVRCDIHAWMSAWIHVVDHPYAALSGDDGSFAIDGVPPGSYTLRVWHEGLGEVERKVVVEAGEDTFVDLTIGE